MQPYNSENGILLSFAIEPISVRTVAVDYHITSYNLPSFKAKIDKLEILPSFTDIISRHCSQEIREIIPVPLRRVRTTRSSTHSYPVQVSLSNPRTLSHKSSFIQRTCNLWNVLPSSCFPESYNLPSFKSKTNLSLSLP